ncbi:MAG: hypothetical protein HYV39_03545 [Candidatus Levybacteria bacterium]|nr:hypothetical protein [Candidatus Levybacteria bacterium]
MLEPGDHGKQENPQAPKPIGEIIAFLRRPAFHPEKTFYEHEVLGEIKPDDIRNLLLLPFEVALTEKNNRVILSTGTQDDIGDDPDLLSRMRHSRLYLHTHPPLGEKRRGANAPSFSDAIVATYSGTTTPQIVAHEEGMMLYQGPSFDPITKQPFDSSLQDTRDLVFKFGEANGLDIFEYGLDPKLVNPMTLPFQEVAPITRRFTEEAKMIRKEASWGDEEGIAELMKFVNLKT